MIRTFHLLFDGQNNPWIGAVETDLSVLALAVRIVCAQFSMEKEM